MQTVIDIKYKVVKSRAKTYLFAGYSSSKSEILQVDVLIQLQNISVPTWTENQIHSGSDAVARLLESNKFSLFILERFFR